MSNSGRGDDKDHKQKMDALREKLKSRAPAEAPPGGESVVAGRVQVDDGKSVQEKIAEMKQSLQEKMDAIKEKQGPAAADEKTHAEKMAEMRAKYGAGPSDKKTMDDTMNTPEARRARIDTLKKNIADTLERLNPEEDTQLRRPGKKGKE